MSVNVAYSEAATAEANGIHIVYDTFGDPTAPPILLIMGLGGQMIAWDEAFCTQLAGEGFWVIRFDNRDAGFSTSFDDAGVPDPMVVMQSAALGRPVNAPYLLRDMADDAAGLLDALSIKSAHIVGVSMGGMIAQTMAIHHPHRVRTLASIMSHTGERDLPPPTPEALMLLATPAPDGREAYIDYVVRAAHVIGSPGFPFDEARIRERAARAYDRARNPAGEARQLAAIMASGGRKEALQALTIPTLVVHGKADTLVPVAGGIATAEAIPGARLMLIDGMGHDLPPAVWDQVIGAIATLAREH
ncbi:MAG: alpha/beta fold hydrolase [Anaerolineae bacterium]